MPTRTSRIRCWRSVSLSPDMSLPLPRVEQPGPEGPGVSEIAFEARPQLPNLARANEGEDVVRLRLPHQLPDEVGSHVEVRALEPGTELIERELAIPEKIGPPLGVQQ